ncbi:hypothetical protein ACFQ38_11605, partial [Sporosarcina contaminans]
MSILNPKIRFVSSADGVGFETLFVDVLLFSFQGSFRRLSQKQLLYNITLRFLCQQLFLKTFEVVFVCFVYRKRNVIYFNS